MNYEYFSKYLKYKRKYINIKNKLLGGGININIIYNKTDTIILNVNDTDTILNIKEKIKEKTNIDIKNQILIYLNEEQNILDDSKTIQNYGIDSLRTLFLFIKKENTLNIQINNKKGEKIFNNIIIGELSTVNDLKNIIKTTYKLEKFIINLEYKNILLEDNKLLNSYNIKDNSIINIILLIKIFIQDNKTKKIKEIILLPNDIIKTLQPIIEKEFFIKTKLQYLIFEENRLWDITKSFNEYNIFGEKTILVKEMEYININFKSKIIDIPLDPDYVRVGIGPKEICLDVSNTSVLNFKFIIMENINELFEFKCIQLKFRGKLLEDDKYLSLYGISNKDTIDCYYI
jgi:acyl carrier protein